MSTPERTELPVVQGAVRCKAAQNRLAATSGERRNNALLRIAGALSENREAVFSANRADLDEAERNGLARSLLERLKFDRKKLDETLAGIKALAGLPDPIGKVLEARALDDSLMLRRVSAPIGVIAVIFESRPDTLAQIASLCLKSGNGIILKGGSEAARTNAVLAQTIAGAAEPDIPGGWIQLLKSRTDVDNILSLNRHIDLIVPRGSNALVRSIMERSSIPVLGHADGICHLFLASDADPQMAARIATDAKAQYPAACNAIETLLVEQDNAEKLLPPAAAALKQRGVELRGCSRTVSILGERECAAATDKDWSTEYLDLVLSIRVVDSLDEAIAHINRYGSGHTDVIVTQSPENARRFMDQVDSAGVYWNCSSRFADGFVYGLGAEVGISTGKIHARGPVGLEGLTSSQWRLSGNGHIIADYKGEAGRPFTHRELPPDGGVPG